MKFMLKLTLNFAMFPANLDRSEFTGDVGRNLYMNTVCAVFSSLLDLILRFSLNF